MMENRTEIFIKYLDNELSDKEKKVFENELLSDRNIKREFDLFMEDFNSLKTSKIKVDETYFNSLIPKARKRIEKTKSIYVGKFAYLLPVIIIMGVILFNTIFQDNHLSENGFEKLLTSYSTNEEIVDELIVNVYSNDQDFTIDNELFDQLYVIENIDDDIILDYLAESMSISESENYFLSKLSEEEFNQIYNELLNKQF